MAPKRRDQEATQSRHSHRSRRDGDDASVDSGYGGSAANSPKDTYDAHRNALRDYHAESARHHAESGRRSGGPRAAAAGEEEEAGSGSDTDYDPRDRYYLEVDDDEYDRMTSAAAAGRRGSSSSSSSTAPERDARGKARQRRGSDASASSRRGAREDRGRDTTRGRHDTSSSSRRRSTASGGSGQGGRRTRRHSSARSEASTAPRPRHEPSYRSLSPIPSAGSWHESEDSRGHQTSTRRRRRRAASTSRPREPGGRRGGRGRGRSRSRSRSRGRGRGRGRSCKSRDESAHHIDPSGEAAKSFLDRLTRGVDLRSVGKVGLDAAAVAAIKVAVGTQVPWKQRIPRTITVGAAAAIMDFVVKKTSFRPKGMIGTIYARQFLEIVLANLIVNPVSSRVTGAAKGAVGARGGRKR